MSDQPSEEELQDRRLFTLARRLVSACKGVGLSPADTMIVLATAAGVAIAHSENQWTDETRDAMVQAIESTIAIESALIREQQPLQ